MKFPHCGIASKSEENYQTNVSNFENLAVKKVAFEMLNLQIFEESKT